MRKESDHLGANEATHQSDRNEGSKNNGDLKPRPRHTRSPEAAPPAASPPSMTQWAAEDLRNSAQCLLDYYAPNAHAFDEFIPPPRPSSRRRRPTVRLSVGPRGPPRSREPGCRRAPGQRRLSRRGEAVRLVRPVEGQ